MAHCSESRARRVTGIFSSTLMRKANPCPGCVLSISLGWRIRSGPRVPVLTEKVMGVSPSSAMNDSRKCQDCKFHTSQCTGTFLLSVIGSNDNTPRESQVSWLPGQPILIAAGVYRIICRSKRRVLLSGSDCLWLIYL